MNTKQSGILKQNKIFVLIALVTGAILLIPLAFQLTVGTGIDDKGFNWQATDFIIMGIMLFGISSTYVLMARKINHKHRIATGIAFLIGFLWLWAELAVGIFTNWGN